MAFPCWPSDCLPCAFCVGPRRSCPFLLGPALSCPCLPWPRSFPLRTPSLLRPRDRSSGGSSSGSSSSGSSTSSSCSSRRSSSSRSSSSSGAFASHFCSVSATSASVRRINSVCASMYTSSRKVCPCIASSVSPRDCNVSKVCCAFRISHGGNTLLLP